jgi:hypothetical protein
MANKILHKRSATSSNVPTAGQLEYGELAINYADGKVFMKRSDDAIIEVGPAVTTSTTQPSSARNGDIWVDTTASAIKMYAEGSWRTLVTF